MYICLQLLKAWHCTQWFPCFSRPNDLLCWIRRWTWPTIKTITSLISSCWLLITTIRHDACADAQWTSVSKRQPLLLSLSQNISLAFIALQKKRKWRHLISNKTFWFYHNFFGPLQHLWANEVMIIWRQLDAGPATWLLRRVDTGCDVTRQSRGCADWGPLLLLFVHNGNKHTQHNANDRLALHWYQ